MNEYSGMTNRELFDLNGTLSAERIESLLDIEATVTADDIDPLTIDEAVAQFPDEGFLTDISQRVVDIAKRCRGRNREDLLDICAALGDLEMTTFYAAEYGISELRQLQAALDRAGY